MPSALRRLALFVSLTCLFVTGLVVPTGGTAQAALPPTASSFAAIARSRVADTRPGHEFGFRRLNSTTVRVGLTGKLPAGTTTVVLNITALNSGGFGAVTAYPHGETAPATAHVLLTGKGQSRTGMVTVRLGTATSVDIKYTTPVTLLVDLLGAYVSLGGASTAKAGRFVPLLGTKQAIVSRALAPGGTVAADLTTLGVPQGASAAVVALNSEGGGAGYWSAYADGGPRTTSDLWIDTVNQRRTNFTIVPLRNGVPRIRVFSQVGGRITVDVIGYYTGSSASASIDGVFIPTTSLTPYRRVDTRSRSLLAPMGPTTVEFTPGTSYVVAGVVGTLRVSDGWDAGTAVTRPAGVNATPMPAARVPMRTTFTVPFHARNSNRGVAITLNKGAHVVVDVAGWFLGPRSTATIAGTKVNVIAATTATYLRWTDAGGRHVKPIEISPANDSYTTTVVANRGNVVGYKGLSTLGKPGNTMLFAHRTSHGGIFYSINTIPVGATFGIRGANGKWHNYRVVNRQVTSPSYTRINGIASLFPPVTAQLVACSKPDGSPTSTSYRIVVTGILVSVTNT